MILNLLIFFGFIKETKNLQKRRKESCFASEILPIEKNYRYFMNSLNNACVNKTVFYFMIYQVLCYKYVNKKEKKQIRRVFYVLHSNVSLYVENLLHGYINHVLFFQYCENEFIQT